MASMWADISSNHDSVVNCKTPIPNTDDHWMFSLEQSRPSLCPFTKSGPTFVIILKPCPQITVSSMDGRCVVAMVPTSY